MTYNRPSGRDLQEHLAERLTDSDLRRVGALALLNMGFPTAARTVLAGGQPDFPNIREARQMTARTHLWWIAFDLDTITLLRMLIQTADPRRTPLAIPA